MQPKVYHWIPVDTQAVSLTQTLAGAGRLALNGTLSVSNDPVVYLQRMVRTITLTSVNNLSAVNFTIVGTSNGTDLQEVLAGPNADTVTSVNFYDSIISITASGAAAAVSAGIGSSGYTSAFFHNYDSSVYNCAIQVNVNNNGGTISYSFRCSSVQITKTSMAIADTLTFTPIAAMTAANTSELANITIPIKNSYIDIISSTGNAELFETILEQGIR